MSIPCPFVYADGHKCTGHITRIEAYKADIEWTLTNQDQWNFDWFQRSHYHLFCSEKGNHAGYKKRDDDRMKFFLDDLPEEARAMLEATSNVML